MRGIVSVIVGLAALGALGCGGDHRDLMDTQGSGLVTVSEGQEDTSEASDSDDGADGAKLDVAAGDTGADDVGCRKIDFLFVIDNSKSMETEQALLASAFPGFVEAIEEVLPDATDFHVGVTTTDDHGLVPGTFMQQPVFADDPCMTTLGGLVDRSTPSDGNTGYGEPCGFESGTSYITSGDDLVGKFSCAARVGVFGYTGERQAGAAIAALSPELNGPGGCNEGFLRDDALLVLVVITDEDDDESFPDGAAAEGRAQQWHQAVVNAKGGIDGNAVVLLISGGSPKYPDCPPLDLGGVNGAGHSEVLTSWVTRFDNHGTANVCAEGYDEAFAEVIGTIETACDDFVPVG